MITKQKVYYKEIAKFVQDRNPLFPMPAIEQAILKHLEFNTFAITHDLKGITGFVRFNINGECAHILNLVIRKDCEKTNIIKHLALQGWSKFPFAQFFSFERESKYPNRKPRAYLLSKLLLKGK